MSPFDRLIVRTFDVDTLLELIAKEELGLKTLATRNSDSLDFHDIAVWKLRGALCRAYTEGCNSASLQQQEQGDDRHA